jgi:6-pyruvoyl-tetrahydropterin synthase
MLKSVVNPSVQKTPSITQTQPVLNITENDTLQSDDTPVIPKKVLFNTSLSGLQGYEEIRKKAKADKLKTEFILDCEEVLKYFKSKQTEKYDHKTLLFVMNLAEQYFYKDKMGDTKLEVVEKLMLPYYDNNEELLKNQIEFLLYKVEKPSVISRYVNKGVSFLCQSLTFILGK